MCAFLNQIIYAESIEKQVCKEICEESKHLSIADSCVSLGMKKQFLDFVFLCYTSILDLEEEYRCDHCLFYSHPAALA